MSERHKTNAELLQCSQRVDSSLFSTALNNRIAQDNSKYIYIYTVNTYDWNGKHLEYIQRIQYIFLSKKNFQATSHFQKILVSCN